MIAVDRSALIAILHREPEADNFLRAIADASQCLLSAVSLLEARMVLANRFDDATAWEELDALIHDAGMRVVAHDAALAHAARDAFLRFGKGRDPTALNMGDCAAYALSKQANAPLLFKGNDFSRSDIVAAR